MKYLFGLLLIGLLSACGGVTITGTANGTVNESSPGQSGGDGSANLAVSVAPSATPSPLPSVSPSVIPTPTSTPVLLHHYEIFAVQDVIGNITDDTINNTEQVRIDFGVGSNCTTQFHGICGGTITAPAQASWTIDSDYLIIEDFSTSCLGFGQVPDPNLPPWSCSSTTFTVTRDGVTVLIKQMGIGVAHDYWGSGGVPVY